MKVEYGRFVTIIIYTGWVWLRNEGGVGRICNNHNLLCMGVVKNEGRVGKICNNHYLHWMGVVQK